MKKILSLIAFGALLLAGCQKPHKLEINTEPDPMRFVQVTVPSEKIPAEGGSLAVDVISEIPYTVSVAQKDQSWLSYTPSNGGVLFTASANSSAVLRFASVALLNEDNYVIQRFDIYQEGTAKEDTPTEKKAFSVAPTEISVTATETSATFAISAEVEWTVASNNDAFVPSATSGENNASITVSFPANTKKEEVKATLTVKTTNPDVETAEYQVVITQAAAADQKPAVKPAVGTVLAEWYFATSQLDILNQHFAEEVSDPLADAPGNGGCYVEPNVKGKGRLEYYNGCDKVEAGIVDAAHKRCKRSTGTYGEPVVYGTYKGDYILWTAYTEDEAPLAAGTKLRLRFTLRPNNAIVMKFWLVEYLDGTEWKVAGTAKEGDGFKYNVELFYASGSGNQTNTTIEPTVTLTNDTPCAQFRITAVSNANSESGNPVTLIDSSGALRFAGEDCNAKTPQYSVKEHPIIDVVE